jgi:hypothetical protein
MSQHQLGLLGRQPYNKKLRALSKLNLTDAGVAMLQSTNADTLRRYLGMDWAIVDCKYDQGAYLQSTTGTTPVAVKKNATTVLEVSITPKSTLNKILAYFQIGGVSYESQDGTTVNFGGHQLSIYRNGASWVWLEQYVAYFQPDSTTLDPATSAPLYQPVTVNYGFTAIRNMEIPVIASQVGVPQKYTMNFAKRNANQGVAYVNYSGFSCIYLLELAPAG